MDDWERWVKLWRAFGAKPADRSVFEQLLARYAEPWRAYHTMQHVRDCLRHLDEAKHLSQRPAEIELALWFHDAVYESSPAQSAGELYDTQRSDNEELSARWAYQHALDQNLPEAVALRVHDLILATKHDAPLLNPEAALLADIDLVILGQPAPDFDLYEVRIRREYSWMPESDFCKGRAKILEGFLRRDSIYRTGHLRDRYERQARLNLERSLLKLRAGSSAP
jgi:predicted metal-dependent HD superfamily phosphohydrolase